MKGSLTATSSTSSHWSATLATSLPIRPNPAAQTKNPSQIHPKRPAKQQSKPDPFGCSNSPLIPILMGAAHTTETNQKKRE
jgi:hypothetical protein